MTLQYEKKGKTILNILKCDCLCKDYWHLIENLLFPAIFALTFSIALSLNLTILTWKATTANCLWLNRRVGHLLMHNVSESKHICPAASMYGHLWKLDSECLFVWGSMAQSGHSVDRSHAWGVVFICLCRDATAASCGASPKWHCFLQFARCLCEICLERVPFLFFVERLEYGKKQQSLFFSKGLVSL